MPKSPAGALLRRRSGPRLTPVLLCVSGRPLCCSFGTPRAGAGSVPQGEYRRTWAICCSRGRTPSHREQQHLPALPPEMSATEAAGEAEMEAARRQRQLEADEALARALRGADAPRRCTSRAKRQQTPQPREASSAPPSSPSRGDTTATAGAANDPAATAAAVTEAAGAGVTRGLAAPTRTPTSLSPRSPVRTSVCLDLLVEREEKEDGGGGRYV